LRKAWTSWGRGATEEIYPDVTTHPSAFEITWAPDGRATFSNGEERIAGKAHVIWRPGNRDTRTARCGTDRRGHYANAAGYIRQARKPTPGRRLRSA
jgi:hypothetical protein